MQRVSGAQSLPQQPRHRAQAHPGKDSPLSQGHSHPHPHSDWDTVDTPFTSHAHLWDVGGNLSSLEKTHTDVERTCKLHTDGGPSQKLIFFLINIKMRQHWTKWCYSGACYTKYLTQIILWNLRPSYVACCYLCLIEGKTETQENYATVKINWKWADLGLKYRDSCSCSFHHITGLTTWLCLDWNLGFPSPAPHCQFMANSTRLQNVKPKALHKCGALGSWQVSWKQILPHRHTST